MDMGFRSQVGEGGRLKIGDSGGIAPLRGGAEVPGESNLRELGHSRGLRVDTVSSGDGVRAMGAGWEGRESKPGSEKEEQKPEDGSGCTGGEGGRPLRELAQEWVQSHQQPTGA